MILLSSISLTHILCIALKNNYFRSIKIKKESDTTEWLNWRLRKVRFVYIFLLQCSFCRFTFLSIEFFFFSPWITSFNTYFRAGLLLINSLNFHLSKKSLFFFYFWRTIGGVPPPPNTANISFCFRPVCMASDEESAVILCFSWGKCPASTPSFLQDFLFVLGFLQFENEMPICIFFDTFLAWLPQSFLDLWFGTFYYFYDFLGHYEDIYFALFFIDLPVF